MHKILTADKWFALAFATLLSIDLAMTFYPGNLLFGYVTKVLLVSLLLSYFLLKNERYNRWTQLIVVLALLLFFGGEVMVVYEYGMSQFVFGLLFIVLAKLCYSFVFLSKVKFDIDNLLPYLVFTLVYSMVVIYFLYDIPGNIHLPAYLYLLIALIMLKLAYLRHDGVNGVSFWLVLIGAVLFLVSETMLVFHPDLLPVSLASILILTLYGFSQYFLLLGLLREQG